MLHAAQRAGAFFIFVLFLWTKMGKRLRALVASFLARFAAGGFKAKAVRSVANAVCPVVVAVRFGQHVLLGVVPSRDILTSGVPRCGGGRVGFQSDMWL